MLVHACCERRSLCGRRKGPGILDMRLVVVVAKRTIAVLELGLHSVDLWLVSFVRKGPRQIAHSQELTDCHTGIPTVGTCFTLAVVATAANLSFATAAALPVGQRNKLDLSRDMNLQPWESACERHCPPSLST
jgi:hypothetical protein